MINPKDILPLLDRLQLKSCILVPLEFCNCEDIAKVIAAMEPWRSLGYNVDVLARYMKRPDPALNRFGVLVAGEMAGAFCVRFPWLLGPFLELMAVFERFQGRGVGREIMKWVEAQAVGTSRNLWTSASSFNTRARSFYGRLGFTEVAVLPDLVKNGYEEILLRKRLDTSA